MDTQSFQTRRMTAEEALEVLRAYHAILAGNDEADDIPVSHKTKVIDLVCYWNDTSWRSWRPATSVLNNLFGINIPLSEWKPILTPQKKRTLQHVCDFIAERAVVPEIPKATLLGKPCRTAGAFLTIRAMLKEQGVDVSELAPSTPLHLFANVGLPEIHMQLTRVAPSLMSRFNLTYRSEAGHILVGALLFFATVAVGVIAGAHSLVVGISFAILTLGALLLVQWSSVKRKNTPSRVEVDGLRDFRDLSRVLADERGCPAPSRGGGRIKT